MARLKPETSLLAAAALLALAGCEIKREDEPATSDPTPQAGETAFPASSPSPEELATASIIRPDVSVEPIVDVPPEPLGLTIPFPQGGYDLDDRATRLLEDVLASKPLREGWPIVLRGHTDSVGTDSGNLIASEKRAETVAGWFVDHGIAHERIHIVALGEQRPIAPNAHLDGSPDEAGRAENRRVEIWIAPPGRQSEQPKEDAGEAAAPPADGDA
ncbi:conserved hypothetical protein [Altererythrobacter sp. B11]|uniref:OmpA family protein n=1 Tax=Altererythrobacter sp. B11 TaxID=2060312 RepID=UPI000DC730AF|nr:OmpA family protein [Altererythrobacter sp. B11]BBC71353.1 conserved hypothetical protein [Altererythrobacter sp. B11]